jgi:hypothetical protein
MKFIDENTFYLKLSRIANLFQQKQFLALPVTGLSISLLLKNTFLVFHCFACSMQKMTQKHDET